MALIPKINVCETQDSKYLDVSDVTGTYDSPTNEGGFGVPNPVVNDVTSALLEFTFEDIQEPISINLVIVAGTVTSGTKTDQLGNITPLELVDYNISVFPFPANSPVRFPCEFFFPGQDKFQDQILVTNYELTGSSFDESTERTFLLNQLSCCCVTKAWVKYSEGKCQDQDPIKIANALNALNYQFSFGNLVATRDTLKRLKKLCQSCGCGC